MFKVRLKLGDISGDGHCRGEDVYYQANYSAQAIWNAIRDTCRATQVYFWDVPVEECNDPIVLYKEYSDCNTPEEAINRLKEVGVDAHEDSASELSYLLMEFAKYSLPDLEFTKCGIGFELINMGTIGYGCY